MSLIWFKLLSMLMIIGVALFGGLVAVYFSKKQTNRKFFSYGNAFSGGIFLGAGFLHLLPEASHQFEEFEFPLAFLIALIAFVAVFYLEKLLLKDQHTHSGDQESKKLAQKEKIYPYVLTIVLSIHSLIAGIALGSMEDLSIITVILIAILAHKGSEAFALGINLVKHGLRRGAVITTLLIFVMMSPIGILIGAFLAISLENSHTASILAHTFDSLAAGTFIYVGIVDIIMDEFSDNKNINMKFLILLVGIAVMAAVNLLHVH